MEADNVIDTGRQHKQLELLQGQGRCSVGGVGGGWIKAYRDLKTWLPA